MGCVLATTWGPRFGDHVVPLGNTVRRARATYPAMHLLVSAYTVALVAAMGRHPLPETVAYEGNPPVRVLLRRSRAPLNSPLVSVRPSSSDFVPTPSKSF